MLIVLTLTCIVYGVGSVECNKDPSAFMTSTLDMNTCSQGWYPRSADRYDTLGLSLSGMIRKQELTTAGEKQEVHPNIDCTPGITLGVDLIVEITSLGVVSNAFTHRVELLYPRIHFAGAIPFLYTSMGGGAYLTPQYRKKYFTALKLWLLDSSWWFFV